MTFFYTLILITLILISNILIYFVLESYNSRKLSDDIGKMLSSIESFEWIIENDDDEQKHSEKEKSEKYNEYEKEEEEEDESLEELEKNSEEYEIKLPSAVDLIIPKTLDIFSYYFIYDNEGNLVNWKTSNDEFFDIMSEESLKLVIGNSAKLINISSTKKDYYLMIKLPIVIDNKQIAYYSVAEDVSLVFNTLDNLKTIMIIVTIISFILSIGIGYIIAGKTIKPVMQAYETKERFIGDASHELRTPISVILLSIELLKGELNPLSKDGPEILDDVLSESLKMKELVEKLLFLARNDSVNLSIERKTVDISELLNSNIRIYNAIALNKEINFDVNISSNLKVQGDYSLLNSAISTLIDNAIKYNKQNGLVCVFAKNIKIKNKDYVKIQIKDSGIGINSKDLDKIFERFYRQDISRSKEVEGHGLGLSIAKAIIESHSGEIEVESKLNVGTTFTVLLKA